jgi:HPt (histidine-containing phosphotransfer) domain-containing protein
MLSLNVDVTQEREVMNAANFVRMAHGDLAGLKELAFDYFNDTRRLMTVWSAMLDSDDYPSLREELHRCKGGASLFGLERIVAMIGDCERPLALETRGFDLKEFEKELSDAEGAVTALTDVRE